MKTKVEEISFDIEDKIQSQLLTVGDALPSLNAVQKHYGVSRDTVVRAYRDLKKRGLIEAVKGRAYFVADSAAKRNINVFLMLDELSEYKNSLVKSFANNLDDNVGYKLFFHHYSEDVFEQLIVNNLDNFTHFLISPIPNSKRVGKLLSMIPPHQLMFVDRRDTHDQNVRFLGQQYEKDIVHCLKQLREDILKYTHFSFVFGESAFHPQELKTGFQRFCEANTISFDIVTKKSDITLKAQCAYLVIDDEDLATIVKQAQAQHLEVGKDIGLISYNETCLKSIIANGITTISTDFTQMGKTLSDMLVRQDKLQSVHNPMMVLKRSSL